MDAERYEIWRDLIPGAREALASAERFERDLNALRVAAGATDEEIATLRERILKLARQVPDPLPDVTRQVGRKWFNERKKGELDPVMRSRAQDVIDNPDNWVLGGALIWTNHITRERVTDQAVEAVRHGR